MISEINKNRFQFLAGINENIQLVSNTGGRSDKGTLGYYVEEYLLGLNSMILSSINNFLKSKNKQINISQQNIKISENTMIVKFQLDNKEFLMTSMVSFNENANTSVSLSSGSNTEKFNLSSKHSGEDVNRFIEEVIQRISNHS